MKINGLVLIFMTLFFSSQAKDLPMDSLISPNQDSNLGRLVKLHYGTRNPDLEKGVRILLFLKEGKLDFPRQDTIGLDEMELPKISSSIQFLISNPDINQNPNLKLNRPFYFSPSYIAAWDLYMKVLNLYKDKPYYQKVVNRLEINILLSKLEVLYRQIYHSYSEKEKNSLKKHDQEFLKVLMDLAYLTSSEDSLGRYWK